MKIDINQPIYLIGAGGHCKVILDILLLREAKIGGYHDLKSVAWIDNLKIPKITELDIADLCKQKSQLCMAFLGREVQDLRRRFIAMSNYQLQGAVFPCIVHPNAIVSYNAELREGVQVLGGAVLNASCIIKAGAIINTGSIVEHDAVVGYGAHVGPGSIVLGAAQIGDNSYLGAGCIVIQGRCVNNDTFIKARSIYNEQSK